MQMSKKHLDFLFVRDAGPPRGCLSTIAEASSDEDYSPKTHKNKNKNKNCINHIKISQSSDSDESCSVPEAERVTEYEAGGVKALEICYNYMMTRFFADRTNIDAARASVDIGRALNLSDVELSEPFQVVNREDERIRRQRYRDDLLEYVTNSCWGLG
jgi:hypothetical protein